MAKAVVVESLSKKFNTRSFWKARSSFRETLGRKLSSALGMKDLPRVFPGDPDGAFWALKGVSFEVEKGETLGIVGKNGSGKTTLIRILSGIMDPSEGSVRLTGPVATLIGVGTGLHPELTGRENVYLYGTILGMKKQEIRAKFDSITDFSGVGPFLDFPIKRYSSGMTLRLAFAVAAHVESEIYLLDEVFAVGDAEFRKRCLGKIRELSGKGAAVLLASHNVRLLPEICQKGLWLEKGRAAGYGAISEVIPDYLRSCG
ncbi:MAG: ABC transporter ATP-binding protein [Candidatus Omnitrophica bacterium]|nr:ABC transporter ATP-binding protein [Candidatus Omnitrophota bacterium]